MSSKTSGPCPYGCGEMIEIEIGSYGNCPKCDGRVKGVPDRVSSGRSTAGAKISFADFHKFIVEELAHLLELEINGMPTGEKKDFLLSFLPASIIEDTLERAKRLVQVETEELIKSLEELRYVTTKRGEEPGA